MGLVPGTTYVISVEKSPQFASIKPESVTVKAEAKDITNVMIHLATKNNKRL